MTPVAGNPDGVGTRRGSPAARNPDIGAAIPAVIAGDPDPSGMRARAGVFDDDGRWADTDIDTLRRCGGEAGHAQERRCGEEEEFLFHDVGLFLFR